MVGRPRSDTSSRALWALAGAGLLGGLALPVARATPADAPAAVASSSASLSPTPPPSSSASSSASVTAAPAASSTPIAAEEPPDPKAVTALRSDLERLVEVQQSGSWRIDRYEIEDMMPSALMSVCRVTPRVRATVLADLEARIVALGGPADKKYAELKDVSAMKPLVFVTRVRDLLKEAMARADKECPFWVEREPHFRGLQGDAGRISLNVETGGLLQLRYSEGKWAYGGGGGGRLLLSRGFGDVSFLFGPELSGGAMLKPGAQSFVVNFLPAVPFVLRLWNVSWHYDVEVAPVALFTADDTRLSWGFRGALAVGVQSRRTRGVIPWAGVGVAYEHYFGGVRPVAEFLRGGLRVGIVWN